MCCLYLFAYIMIPQIMSKGQYTLLQTTAFVAWHVILNHGDFDM